MTLNIDKVMKDKGYNAVSLSEKMGELGTPLRRETIGTIVNGTANPTLKNLEAIATAMNVTLFDLFDGYVPEASEPIYKKDGDGNFIEIGHLKSNLLNTVT